jgi:pyridoxal phosphate enzyme (YggS family)
VTPAERLAAVRERIAVAARTSGRDPGAVELVAVSKYHQAFEVRELAAAGQAAFAESRQQDLAAKQAELADLDLVWHFIGRLQTNKATAVARTVDLLHSLDRPALVVPLARGAADRDAPLPVLLQVSLDGDPDRGGAPAADLPRLAALVAAEPALDLAGVMAVASPASEPGPQFDRLRRLAGDLRRDHPTATTISAGMSGDLAAAVAAGATLVRVGTALFAAPEPAGRPPVSRLRGGPGLG